MQAKYTRSALVLVLAAVTSLTVTACGDDDGSKSSSATSPTTGQAPVQTQPQTGGAGTDGAGATTGSTGKSGTTKRSQKGSSTKTDQAQGQTPSTGQPKKKPSGAHSTPPWVRKYDYAQAKKVCEVLGLKEVARQYKAKSLDPAEVARTYAANDVFPANRKANIAKGCRAGLRHSK